MSFIATLVDIKRVDSLPHELRAYVDFKAELNRRKLSGMERVAIFNIATTASYIPVFLDKGKSLEDIEKEIKNEADAVLTHEGREILKHSLENERR